MPILLGITAIVGLILLANVIDREQEADYGRYFDWFLLIINVGLGLMGLLYMFLPSGILARLQADGAIQGVDLQRIGIGFFCMGVWGGLISVQQVRRVLANWLPLSETRAVHTLALALSGYVVGYTITTLAATGLEDLAETAVATDLTLVVGQQLLFAVIAFLGVGLFTRRRDEEVRIRLGLKRLTGYQLGQGVIIIGALVVVQWVTGFVSFLLNPEQLELVDGISGTLLGEFDTVWEWFALALSAGIGEELLFRGALQPVLGLWVTAVIFAVAHIQYGFSAITVGIFIIGVALGYVRRYGGTTMAIFVHFGYNFVLGLLTLLAQSLQQSIQ